MIRIFVTGGTFDKTYDEISGVLTFGDTRLPEMLRIGRSRVEMTIRTLMMIHSLDMTDADREVIAHAIGKVKYGRLSVFAEALDLAADFLQKNPLENKHIVLITDGTDSSRDQSAKRDAIQRLLTTEISVHVLSYTRMEVDDLEPRTKGVSNTPPPPAMPEEIAQTLPNGVRDTATTPKAKTINLDRTLLRKLRARKTDLETSERQLESLAENTNGTVVIPESLDEMVDKTAHIAKLIDASYAVTYIPKVPIASGSRVAERKIEVTSKRPGLQVQARRKLFVDRR